jgi:hypothetical protein
VDLTLCFVGFNVHSSFCFFVFVFVYVYRNTYLQEQPVLESLGLQPTTLHWSRGVVGEVKETMKRSQSSLAGVGRSDGFNLSNVHSKTASYDSQENFDFKKPTNTHQPDQDFFSLPPAVSNSRLTWKDRGPKPIKSASASRLLSSSQPGLFGHTRPESVTKPQRISVDTKIRHKNQKEQGQMQAIDELNFAAVQSNSDSTWQYVGRVNASYER